MLIKVYGNTPINGKFVCKDTIVKAKSVIWDRKFYDVGNFQISMEKTDLQLGDIIVHGNNSGIVMKVVQTFESAEVYGYDLKGLTKFRYVVNQAIAYKNPLYCVWQMANAFLINAQNLKRCISGLTNSTAPTNTGESKQYLIENQLMSDAIYNFCKDNDVGYDITFSENGMVFAPLGKVAKHDLIFAREFHNLESAEITNDELDIVNMFYYESEGTIGEYPAQSFQPEGIARREGKDNFKNKDGIQTLRGVANDKLVYGTDYKLGDEVTVRFRDFETTKIITEVKEVYEFSKKLIIPTFGTEKENPLKKILR